MTQPSIPTFESLTALQQLRGCHRALTAETFRGMRVEAHAMGWGEWTSCLDRAMSGDVNARAQVWAALEALEVHASE